MKEHELKTIMELKSNIKRVFEETKKPLKDNILRGHSRSISTDIEDNIALFISELLPSNYQLLLDPTITIEGKQNRPDLIIIDEKKKLFAIIELKANTGYCRVANSALDNLFSFRNQLSRESTFKCGFSSGEMVEVKYTDQARLFFVSLTDWNNNEKNHISNKEYGLTLGIQYINLFTNWYHSLMEKDVAEFIELLK